MLSKRLEELRKRKSLSQAELSKRLNMARTTYSGYENGSREPDHATLEKIADYFEVTVDYLLGRTNDRTRVLQPQSRKMIDLIDQNVSDEDIYKAFAETFLIDGIPMPKEEALILIDIIRARRARLKKVPDHSDSTDSVSTP